MAEQFGASQEAWHHFAVELKLAEHLLPVVSNPNATISPDSKMGALGKTPSRYNFRGEVAGFAKWTDQVTTMRDIGKWELEPDYGICIQTRAVRAIDIDVPNKKLAAKIVRAIEQCLPVCFFPQRYREGTGKVLLPFLFDGPMPKRVIPVEGGMIEFLGDGQQFVAEGTYIKDGKAHGRYQWQGHWPTDFPRLDETALELLWDTLVLLFAVEEPTIARVRKTPKGGDMLPGVTDPVGRYIAEHWEILDEGRDGELFIPCPFADQHTSDTGPTSTAYFLPGTGGYAQGHFKCLHAHCMKRTDLEFRTAIGYEAAQFPDLEEDEVGPDGLHRPSGEPPETLPKVQAPEQKSPYMIDSKGRKEANTYNLVKFSGDIELSGRQIAFDAFTSQIVVAPGGDERGKERWRPWKDADYARLALTADRNGFKTTQAHTWRPAVGLVAEVNQIDTGVEWTKRLKWDGVRRVETFMSDYLGTEDNPYTRAVGRYLWTALAGRMAEPGVQADMVPILVGAQGTRKTSAVRAMAPHINMFTSVNLMHRDDDTARRLRGVSVVELGELRGLQSRDAEDVKDFITKREEEWVPKYMEFKVTFKRRCVMIGTTNRDDFLADPTGERRYLPIDVCLDGHPIDVDRIEADRKQLWAEGLELFAKSGIDYADAERLARREHHRYKAQDAWEPLVIRWLLEPNGLTGVAPIDAPFEWGVSDMLIEAVGLKASQLNRAVEMRAAGILRGLGASKRQRGGKRLYGVQRFYLEQIINSVQERGE